MSAPIVFFDIAGPDDEALRRFYREVFAWNAGEGGQLNLEVLTPLSANIRKDPAEKRVYVGVEDVTATLDAVVAAGGSVDTPRFEVPGVVVLGLFRDPAGNPMGLVEMEGGEAKVP
ncbi:hypothetical protein ABI59_19260 [Acidobacteria bacterium Mor1]|nr:hypothetical protein ABI59_19260 [Acidobacteria bacterium Mor1]